MKPKNDHFDGISVQKEKAGLAVYALPALPLNFSLLLLLNDYTR